MELRPPRAAHERARRCSACCAPRSVALIGGAWADAAQAASRVIGYTGELWRIHPTASLHRRAALLPLASTSCRAAPDAAFIAAPNREVPAIAAALARRGAGGFVCFAAGFSETATAEGERLTRELLASAGDLPFFGPNCYGFVNFFDGVGAVARPGGRRAPRARRGAHLPERHASRSTCCSTTARCRIGCVLTVGNQTRLAAEDLIELLCRR